MTYQHDPLLTIRSQADARAFVMAAAQDLTDAERRKVVRQYLAMCTREPVGAPAKVAPKALPKPQAQASRATKRARPASAPRAVNRARRGGAKRGAAAPAVDDARVRRLLFEVDRKHDFRTRISPDVIPAELAMDPGDGGAMTVHGEVEFVKQCFRAATLTFPSCAPAQNPMRVPALESPPSKGGEDARTLTLFRAERHRSIPAAADVMTLRKRSEAWLSAERAQNDARLWHLDVWCTSEHKRGLALRLTDVVSLISTTRGAFPECEQVIVDASIRSPLFQLMVALTLVNDAFWDAFVVIDDDAGDEAIPDAVQDLRGRIARRLRKGEAWAQDAWRVVYTDATAFDSGDWMFDDRLDEDARPSLLTPDSGSAVVVVDREATGDVFPPSFDVGVCLKGLDDDGRVTVEIAEGRHDAPKRRRRVTSLTWSKRQCGDLSVANLKDLILAKSDDATEIAPGLQPLRDLSVDALRAIKCASDWGQVERCARAGAMFATCDMLAALYAFYRGVPCVFMREVCTDHKYEPAQKIVRFGFTLMRPP